VDELLEYIKTSPQHVIFYALITLCCGDMIIS